MRKSIIKIIVLLVIFTLIVIIVSSNLNKGSNLNPSSQNNGMMSHSMHGIMTVNSEEQFIKDMIPHHQEAVDTSLIVLDRSSNEELKDLASRIVNAQTLEISMMSGWVNNWFSQGSYVSNYKNMMPDLKKVNVNQMEINFLNGMIMHHQMAVMMAKQVLTLDTHDEVEEFAQEVIKVQSSEINEMRDLLSSIS